MLTRVGLVCVLLAVQCLPCSVPYERRIWSKERDSTSNLFAFQRHGAVGFIDSSGAVVVPPRIVAQIEDVGDFHEGLSVVRSGARPGYIDETGALVISIDRIDAFGLLPFSEGLGLTVASRQTRYIDRNGSVVFETSGSGREFHEGLAVYRTPPKPPEYDRDSPTPAPPPPILSVGSVGYLDKQGSLAIEPLFAAAGPFVDGLAQAVLDGNCYVLTSDKRHLGTPTTGTNTSCGSPPPGADAVCPVGFIDKRGEFVIPPQFDSALDFSEGVAAVFTGGRWGFVDRSGALVVKPQFSAARSFHEGRAAVSKAGSWGFVDKSGELVIPAVWDEAGEFSEGLSSVSRDNQYLYIDRTGVVAIPGPYLEATPFVHGLAAVRVGEHRIHYINRDGDVVFEYSRSSRKY